MSLQLELLKLNLMATLRFLINILRLIDCSCLIIQEQYVVEEAGQLVTGAIQSTITSYVGFVTYIRFQTFEID